MSKVLIIGGGVAGLSAGIYAKLSGHDAVIYERHSIAGGNLTGWNRGEYHIDNCIHWLTGTNPNSNLYKMWKELGALEVVDVIQGNSLFTCERDGQRVSLYNSIEKLRDEMLKVSPEDEKEIKKLIRAIDFIASTDKLAGKNYNEGVTFGRFARGMGPILKYLRLTTGQLANLFKNPAIRCFITGFWGEDFAALALIYVFATYCGNNGGLPAGGSLKMAERMANKFTSLGGELKLKSEVVKIESTDGGLASVMLADGSVDKGDYVVITTDPAVTFGKILDLPMPKQLKKMYDNKKMRRFSAYHCAYACDLAELPFEGDLIFDMPEEYVEELGTKQLIVREFSHEPSYAPEGKNILQTMTFCFDDDAMKFIDLRKDNREAYKAKKERFAEVFRTLIEEHCPELAGKLKAIDVWTPATYNRYINSEIGSFMSFAMPEKYLPLPESGIIPGHKNIILATQWQQSPGGLPIAARSGEAAIKRINKLQKN